MNKLIPSLMLCVLLSGCLNIGSGFRVPPDASARWKLCNEDKIYPAKKTSPEASRAKRDEMLRQMNLYGQRKLDDMFSCGYDPIGGGDSEQDACVRKKGWYRSGKDIYPENKIYEQCQHD